MKRFKLLICIFSTAFLVSQCVKVESPLSNDKIMYQKAISFLTKKQAAVTPYQSNKIGALIRNLSADNLKLINLGGIDLIICDLSEYRNVSKQEFKRTQYKMSFPLKNGEIVSGLVYTIHTNLTKEDVDNDFRNILLVKSERFSGEIITNGLNDRFIQAFIMKEGKLQKAFDLQNEHPGKNGHENSSISSNNCVAYYLVTTNYYSDGHTERESEYLYTICDDCNIVGQTIDYLDNDCDPDAGGGTLSTDETENVLGSGTEDDELFGAAPKIQYNYNATIRRIDGQVTNVFISPTTVSNPVVWYIDNYARSTTRTVIVFGHYNTWTSLGTLALINYSCLVHGKWTYANGDPVYTRQWADAKSFVR